jgi:uncharacterized membrane protein
LRSKLAAQRRADAIRVFNEELARLEVEGGLALTAEQRAMLAAHHAGLLADLGKTYDIDRSAEQARLSTGMRIASFLGAVALSASVFYLFRQFWGRIDIPLQVVILIVAAAGSFIATLAIHRRDASGYFTNLGAMVAFACLVLDLVLLGRIFNLRPSPEALLAWSVYAFVLAYAFDLRSLLAAGLMCGGAYLAARGSAVTGREWSSFIEHPENLFIPAAIAFAVPLFFSHERRPLFPAVYRGLAVATMLLSILVLANVGELSYLTVDKDWIEAAYQWIGFIGSAGIVWVAIRRGWDESMNLGVAFFVIFLLVKFVAWWWETMPRYLFFLVVALTAVLIIIVLRRLRVAATAMRGQLA